MAQFYEDFRGQGLGIIPAGFSTPWGALTLTTVTGNALAASDVSLEIATVSGLGTASFTRAAVEWAAGTTSGRTVVRARMGVSLQVSSQTNWIVGGLLSATGASSGTRGGYAQWQDSTKSRLTRYVSGGGTTLEEVTASWAVDELDLTFEVIRDGALQEHRVWLSSGTRPAVATTSATDASPLSVAGFFGLSMLPRDSGSPAVKLYQIAAANDGDAVPTGPIAVGVAPSNAPVITGASVTTTDTSVSSDFTFDSGANTGDPVTGYEVRVDGGAWQSLGIPSPLAFTVSGLTSSTAYNTPGLELRAINAVGSGPISTAVAFTTASATATPINLSATNVQANSVRLNWERG